MRRDFSSCEEWTESILVPERNLSNRKEDWNTEQKDTSVKAKENKDRRERDRKVREKRGEWETMGT